MEPPKELEFYFGVKEIASFLGLNPHTARRHLRDGKIPARKDTSGRWVLCNLDYFLSLGIKEKSRKRKKTP